MKERFLPTQEWSSGGREYIAKNTPPNVHRRRQMSTAAAPNAKITPDSHSPHRPFLRRQESHSAVHTNIGKFPTNLRPPEDHSCEGRNLIATCRQRRRILGGGRGNGDNSANCGTRQCEIPAFAGMVSGETGVYRQKYARLLPAQLSKSPPIPIPPARPFLRKQESIFNNANGGILRNDRYSLGGRLRLCRLCWRLPIISNGPAYSGR